MKQLSISIRHFFFFIVVYSAALHTAAQGVGVNNDGSSPDASAMLDVKSTGHGILIPRMTTAQKLAISSPATGLMVFDNSLSTFWFYNGTSWEELSSGILSGLSDTDNDTRIHVEQNPDEDLIRFDVAGTEYLRLGSNGSLGIYNTGSSVFLGAGAGFSDDLTGNVNVFLGNNAGRLNTSGTFNSFIGATAGYANTTGGANVFAGYQCGAGNTTGSNNILIGMQAGHNISEGNRNVAIGHQALLRNEVGSNNVAVGYHAGRSLTLHDKTGNVYLGYGAGYEDTTDNKLFIENSTDTATPLIWGDFSNDVLSFSADVGIGTRTQLGQAKLTVSEATTGWNGIYVATSTGGEPFYGYAAGGVATGYSYTDGNDGNKWKLNVPQITRVTVTSSGDVGIGTTSPSALLDVNGDVEIPSTSNYTYATPQTRYLCISNAAFEIATTSTAVFPSRSISGSVASLLRTTGGSSGTSCSFAAPIYLPDGAVVTSVQARVFDSDATYNVGIILARQLWTSTTNSALASMTSIGSSGGSTISDNTISNSTIDNSQYAYQLLFNTRQNIFTLGLYNVRITYTVQNTD